MTICHNSDERQPRSALCDQEPVKSLLLLSRTCAEMLLSCSLTARVLSVVPEQYTASEQRSQKQKSQAPGDHSKSLTVPVHSSVISVTRHNKRLLFRVAVAHCFLLLATQELSQQLSTEEENTNLRF